MVVAYLIRYKGWTALEALSYVRLRRERAKPNANFWNQLQEYQNRHASQPLPLTKIENHERQDASLKPTLSKDNLGYRPRHSEPLPEEETYQIQVHTPKQ